MSAPRGAKLALHLLLPLCAGRSPEEGWPGSQLPVATPPTGDVVGGRPPRVGPGAVPPEGDQLALSPSVSCCSSLYRTQFVRCLSSGNGTELHAAGLTSTPTSVDIRSPHPAVSDSDGAAFLLCSPGVTGAPSRPTPEDGVSVDPHTMP